MTIAHELEQAELVIEDIEDLEEARDAIESSEHEKALESLDRVRERRMSEATVRVSVAAELLGLTPPTIYKWTDLGLLDEPEETNTRVRRVMLSSVLEIRPLVRELQELGQTRHLLRAVLDRIDDMDTLAHPELQKSIRQMRAGETVDITPQD